MKKPDPVAYIREMAAFELEPWQEELIRLVHSKKASFRRAEVGDLETRMKLVHLYQTFLVDACGYRNKPEEEK